MRAKKTIPPTVAVPEQGKRREFMEGWKKGD
jgi:hypothetical protein